MSRVLSIFRPSSSSRNGPALPKRSATERRQQQLKEQDRKFEEQWAKGDWPEWVKKGEFFYERKMLLEMGYPKDRVVEALEVNDFNLAQATDYLLSIGLWSKKTKPDTQWLPTEREQRAYTHLLAISDPQKKGIVEGEAAVLLFQKTGLSDLELGKIWHLADTNDNGHLTAQEFNVAIKLISLSQADEPAVLSGLNKEVDLPQIRGVDWQKVLRSPTNTDAPKLDQADVKRDGTKEELNISGKQVTDTPPSTMMLPSIVEDERKDTSCNSKMQLTGAEEQLARASARKQELEESLKTLQSSHKEKQEANERLEAKLESEESQAVTLQSQVSDATRQLSEVSARYYELGNNISQAQAQQAALSRRLKQVEDDKRHINSKIAIMEHHKQLLDQRLIEMQEQIVRMQNSNQGMREWSQTLARQTNALTRQVLEVEEGAAELAAQMQAQREAVRTFPIREQVGYSGNAFGVRDSYLAASENMVLEFTMPPTYSEIDGLAAASMGFSLESPVTEQAEPPVAGPSMHRDDEYKRQFDRLFTPPGPRDRDFKQQFDAVFTPPTTQAPEEH
ncbi:hypothetical protein EV183_001596 [Coemansia sp. RSA 2336]|nr:hypothetical protein EV183_001596 [Coemansia sp. RSA 2336]